MMPKKSKIPGEVAAREIPNLWLSRHLATELILAPIMSRDRHARGLVSQGPEF
jgi:hypothetical protein